jgi:hypothetical protein
MPSQKKRATTSGAYVALMRGINVGGKNKLSMRELLPVFTTEGCGRRPAQKGAGLRKVSRSRVRGWKKVNDSAWSNSRSAGRP